MARAGRPERPVDPDQGPVQSFAHGLRDIRRKAGDPSYRTLAERTHYSRTVISDAARGERLPTLAVALAYVAACNGDADEWKARWHLAHQQLIEAGTADRIQAGGETDGHAPAPPADNRAATPATPSPTGTPPAPAAGGAGTGRPGRFRALRRRSLIVPVLAALATLLLAQLEVLAVWSASSGKPPAPTATQLAAPTTVLDGADPGTSNCGPSAVVLDSAPIVLPAQAVIGGRTFPKGTVLGTISLRYSPVCRGGWARFDPVTKVYGSDTSAAVVQISILRPADGTESIWRLPHASETYGDLLLTGLGCVVARGSVQLVGPGITATAQTNCLSHR